MKKKVGVKNEVNEIRKTVAGLKSGKLVKTNVKNEERKSSLKLWQVNNRKKRFNCKTKQERRGIWR